MRISAALFVGLVSVAAVHTQVTQPPRVTQIPAGTPPGQTPAPPPAQATGAISGVVIDGVTRQPIEGALVQLNLAAAGAPAGARPRQRTDAQGRFVFHRLIASESWTLQVTREGYFGAGYRTPPGVAGGSRVLVREGEWFSKADIIMWKPAAISGTVRDEHGDPVVGVPVRTIHHVPVAGRMRLVAGPLTTTDDRGQYRLANLKSGRYYIHVPSVQITLADGTAAVGTPTPQAVGGATDTVPDPLTLVQSVDSGRSDGLSLLVGSFPTPGPTSGASAYPMMYHPSARSIDHAEAVSVTYGQHRPHVDVTLMLAPTVRVSGHVSGPAASLAKIAVRLLPVGSEELGEGAEAAMTLTDPQGQFTFLRVPAGDYVVIASNTRSEYSSTTSARSFMPSRLGFFSGSMSGGTVAGVDGIRYDTRSAGRDRAAGRAMVTVADRDISGLAVMLQAGVTVSGTFLWDGSPTPPAGMRFPPMIRLEPVDGNLGVGLPQANMTAPGPPGSTPPSPTPFEVAGVFAGRYIVGATALDGAFSLEAVDYGGQDLLAAPLVVTGDKDIRDVVVRLTSKPMSLSGVVTTSAGAVPASAAVVIFPTDRALWRDYGISAPRFRSAQVTASGAFLPPPGLLAGEYYAAVVPLADRARWVDPEFLNGLVGRATRFRLVAGTPTTLNLRFDGSER